MIHDGRSGFLEAYDAEGALHCTLKGSEKREMVSIQHFWDELDLEPDWITQLDFTNALVSGWE